MSKKRIKELDYIIEQKCLYINTIRHMILNENNENVKKMLLELLNYAKKEL